MLPKHNINFKYANIHRQLPLPREGLGVGLSPLPKEVVGGGPLPLSKEVVGSGFALPSLFLRLESSEKAKAQWSYSEGMTKRLPTEKKLFSKLCDFVTKRVYLIDN